MLDLPPLEKGAGGVQLVDLCDTVALVARAGEVSPHRIEEAAAALNTPPFVILNGVKSAAPSWVRRMSSACTDADLVPCSCSAFLLLGLRKQPKWNVNALVVGVTVIVVLGVAASDHLI